MSCSIDSRRGSILMEFVLVLPIYIFLLGALFLLGEMGLNAIRIASGDRDVAMDAGDRDGYSLSPFKERQMGDEKSNISSVDSRTYRADESFHGSWSWQAAGKTSFSYRLRSWGSVLVSYPFLRYNGSMSGGGILATLVGGGNSEFHSKDFSLQTGVVRSYNYYTLKRTDLARSEAAYRNWDSDKLVLRADGEQCWHGKVYNEAFADANGQQLDLSNQSADDTLPNVPDGAGEYGRYSQFVEWSE